MMSHARSAWWLETKLYARTIAPPPPRFTRQPQKEKMFLAFLIFAGVDFSKMERTFFFLGFCPPSIWAVWRGVHFGFGFFSKRERTFFFLGFCPQSIRAVWRGFNVDSVLQNLFFGVLVFRKTETNL